MLYKLKNKSSTLQREVERPWLYRARARRQDRAATVKLKKALARKAETVAELKRLGMTSEH
jgi:hypothetical protein